MTNFNEAQILRNNEVDLEQQAKRRAQFDAFAHAAVLKAVNEHRLDEIASSDLTDLGLAEVATADGRVWFLHALNTPGDVDGVVQARRGTRSFTIRPGLWGDPCVFLLTPTDDTLMSRAAADQARADQVAAADAERRAWLKAHDYRPVTVSDTLGLSGSRLPVFTLRDAVAQLRLVEARIETTGGKVAVFLPVGLNGPEDTASVIAAVTLSAAAEHVTRHKGDLATLPDRYVTPGGALV